jgi:hypothetical protein
MRPYVLFMTLVMCVVPAFADTSRPNIVVAEKRIPSIFSI